MKPDKTLAAALRVSAVGDDAQPFLIKVLRAWSEDGQSIEVDEKGIIQNLGLEAEQNKNIYIQIDSSDKFSLEVSANET